MLIKNLLDKYHNLKVVDQDLKSFLVSKFKNDFDYELDVKNIKRQGRVVYLNINPTLKSEVLINKQKILQLIRKIDKNINNLK